jgi:Domain of unknown function (DUF222)/HNH endonuclease
MAWTRIEHMFEPGPAVGTRELDRLADALSRVHDTVDDAERVEQIRALERLKSAAAAAQAKVVRDFATSQRKAQAAAGVREKDLGKGIAAQVGLAKRESPATARRYVGWAQILVAELPHTFAALQAGQTTEWRAMIVARETAWLSAEHRATVDAELGPRLGELGNRRTEAEAKKIAYRLDPHGYVNRTRGTEAERRVTVRPAPDTMARLTGFLPVAQAVAAYACLSAYADTLIGNGDGRGRGQIMADTLVQRLTGQTSADAVPATVNLVMTDAALFNRRVARTHDSGPDGAEGADEPAHLDGYGPIPADLARRLVADAPEGTRMLLRRLYADPDTGRLVAMESHSRLFTDGIRRFLVLRDQTCRTPWCNAPVRHADHVVPASEGGPTSADNGQGLCLACNLTKQAPDWRARPGPGGAGRRVVTITPTGHSYTSRAPAAPGQTGRRGRDAAAARAPTRWLTDSGVPSLLEEHHRLLVTAA